MTPSPCTARFMLATSFALALLSGCEGPSAEADAEAAPPPPAPASVECDCPEFDDQGLRGLPDFADHVEAVRPAVVNIYTRTDPPDTAQASGTTRPAIVPEDRVRESLGSGFIFDSSGLILTNDHVINGASEIAVRLLDERIYSADVVGSDPPTDVAVLQLNLEEYEDEEDAAEDDEGDSNPDLPTVTLGDSDHLRVGHWVLAIGNPLGLASTVTAGIASATGRQVMPPGGQLRFQDFIQTDASINPGSSGGPLVDADAEVVGIATAMTPDSQGLGFAIPINMVKEILDDLIEHGRVERSWLGVYIAEVSSSLRDELDLDDTGGALITRLVNGGPADGAGIESGDVVVAIDGLAVEDAHHLAWLAATIGVDRTVDIELYRDGEPRTLPLTMGALPD